MSLKNFFAPLRKKAKKNPSVFILLGFLSFLCISSVVHAQDYRIDSGTVSVDQTAASGYAIGDLWGTYAQKTFNEKGVVARVAPGASQPLYFTTGKTAVAFSNLQDSKESINLGVDYPGNVNLAVSSEGPLRSLDKTQIPDTSCDPGAGCDIVADGMWKKRTTYGFGYSVDGEKYRAFGRSALIFPSFFEGNDKKEQLTLKFTAAPDTAKKTYQTIINLITSISF